MQDNKLFDNFAKQYDAYNNLTSLATHHFVKSKCVKMLDLKPEQRVLDLCTGTGDIARLIKKYSPSAAVFGLDESEKMLEIAKSKSADIEYVCANAESLPFDDGEFDIVTISFGLRNIQNKQTAIDEIKRVLKPNGQFLHIDFGKQNNFAQKIFNLCATLSGKLFLRNVPVNYFLNSIENYWSADEFEKVMEENGFTLQKSKGFMCSVVVAQMFRVLKN